MDYPSLTLWPGETNEDGIVGKPLLPFNIDEDYIIKNLLLRMEKRGLHQVVEAQQKYPFPDIDVTVIKLHELDRCSSGDAVLKEMFCHVVDNMPHSCATVQLDETVKIGKLESNPYYSFNYDMLATAAYEKQLFGFQKKNTTKMQGQRPYRQEISDLIQRYQEDSLKLIHHDFDTICMAKEKMDQILKASIYMEQVIYGSNWTSQQEVSLRQAFFTYQNKRPYTFYWLNTEKTLQDPTWLAFFDNI